MFSVENPNKAGCCEAVTGGGGCGVSNLPDQSHVTDCHTDQVCRQAMKEKPGAIETFYYIRNQFSPISFGRHHNR